MGGPLLGSALLAGLVLAGVRRWVSLPLCVLLGAVWLLALGWVPGHLVPQGSLVALAEAALWSELGWLVLAARGPGDPHLASSALSGFLGGVVGGAGLWALGRAPGLPLLLGFAGSVVACMVRESGPRVAVEATLLLPVRVDATCGLVPLVFFVSVALGAVPP